MIQALPDTKEKGPGRRWARPVILVAVTLVVLRPAGSLFAAVDSRSTVIAKKTPAETGWQMPPRFKLLATLAALGNAQKQFQLGAALLQEPAAEAKAEGFKWLEAAAAQGHRDATLVLAQGREQLARPDRDRDMDRVNCCRPAPVR